MKDRGREHEEEAEEEGREEGGRDHLMPDGFQQNSIQLIPDSTSRTLIHKITLEKNDRIKPFRKMSFASQTGLYKS